MGVIFCSVKKVMVDHICLSTAVELNMSIRRPNAHLYASRKIKIWLQRKCQTLKFGGIRFKNICNYTLIIRLLAVNVCLSFLVMLKSRKGFQILTLPLL